MTNSDKPRIILLSARVGAGHHQAARAIQAGLQQADPSLGVEFIDALDYVPSLFRLYYAGGYTLTVTRLPWLYGLGYWLTNRPRGPGRQLGERMRLALEWRALRRLRLRLTQSRPMLIVNTHYLVMPAIARMIDSGLTGLRQMVVVTDNELHRWWYSHNVQRYFVPTESVGAALQADGVPADRIQITGIPVHPKWRQEMDEQSLRRAWNVPADRPVLLLSGGTDFVVGKVDRLAGQLLERIPHAVLFVLAGHNKKLLDSLARMPQAQGDQPRLKPLAFTDRVNELVSLASLVITKPGGMITSECIARNAPMLLTRPVPGQEAANARYFTEKGAAVVARSAREIVSQAQQLLADSDKIIKMRRAAAELDQPATRLIVERILQEIGK